MTTITAKSREVNARRKAARQGLVLVKSRRRDPDALGFGRYVLLDAATNGNVLPDGFGPTGEPNWTLDEIERYLTDGGS
jgi:hypothetical protein